MKSLVRVGTQTDDGELRGLHLRKPGKTLSHIEPMNTKIDPLLSNLRVLFAEQTFDLAMAMAELASVAAERDKIKAERDGFADVIAHYIAARQGLKDERDNARQSLRAAEQDAAETESVNSDLRTVNARLVADLAAAMDRLNHAESIVFSGVLSTSGMQ
jgi:chromosome segregation ATPase